MIASASTLRDLNLRACPNRRMAWLSQSDLLRAIAKKLPKSQNVDDALAGLRFENKLEEMDKLAESMAKEIVDMQEFTESIKKSLAKHLKDLNQTSGDMAVQNGATNGKFALDPTLFTLSYGLLDDFKKGVRELVGAPHPKVWEEMAKEHRERDDSQREFNPGNYDTLTCAEEEYLVCVDSKKGREASKKGKENGRCARRALVGMLFTCMRSCVPPCSMWVTPNMRATQVCKVARRAAQTPLGRQGQALEGGASRHLSLHRADVLQV